MKIIDVPGPLPESPKSVPSPDYDGPHPFQLPAEGEVLDQQVWDHLAGIEILRRWAKARCRGPHSRT